MGITDVAAPVHFFRRQLALTTKDGVCVEPIAQVRTHETGPVRNDPPVSPHAKSITVDAVTAFSGALKSGVGVDEAYRRSFMRLERVSDRSTQIVRQLTKSNSFEALEAAKNIDPKAAAGVAERINTSGDSNVKEAFIRFVPRFQNAVQRKELWNKYLEPKHAGARLPAVALKSVFADKVRLPESEVNSVVGKAFGTALAFTGARQKDALSHLANAFTGLSGTQRDQVLGALSSDEQKHFLMRYVAQNSRARLPELPAPKFEAPVASKALLALEPLAAGVIDTLRTMKNPYWLLHSDLVLSPLARAIDGATREAGRPGKLVGAMRAAASASPAKPALEAAYSEYMSEKTTVPELRSQLVSILTTARAEQKVDPHNPKYESIISHAEHFSADDASVKDLAARMGLLGPKAASLDAETHRNEIRRNIIHGRNPLHFEGIAAKYLAENSYIPVHHDEHNVEHPQALPATAGPEQKLPLEDVYLHTVMASQLAGHTTSQYAAYVKNAGLQAQKGLPVLYAGDLQNWALSTALQRNERSAARHSAQEAV